MPTPKAEDKLDDSLDDTFPASDPPSNTPIGGTKKSREIAEAHDKADGEDSAAGAAEPAARPNSDRDATEKSTES